MKLLLDMNLPPSLAGLLENDGHEAVYWGDVGSPRARDIEILAWAKEHGYVVLTHDLDFGAILAATGMRSPSVVQMRTRDVFPESIFPHLSRTLRLYADPLTQGALMVIDDRRARVRILPLR